MDMKIALAGNPNCGKTTLFNDLTGSNQYVGNWPNINWHPDHLLSSFLCLYFTRKQGKKRICIMIHMVKMTVDKYKILRFKCY